MSKVRYKIRKEQLERVVESFVMESAMSDKKQMNEAGEELNITPEMMAQIQKVASKMKMDNPEGFNDIKDEAEEVADEIEEKADFMSEDKETGVGIGLTTAGIGSLAAFGNQVEQLASQGNYGVDLSNPLFLAGLALFIAGGSMLVRKYSKVAKESKKDQEIDRMKAIITKHGENSDLGMKAKKKLDMLMKK